VKTQVLSASSSDALPLAYEVLKGGGLVAFPTDTVYGLGALAFDGSAVESLYAAKDRPAEKAIPVLIADPEDLVKVSPHAPPIVLKLAARFWPGPLTLVVPKPPDLPESVSATPTVGVRLPDHPVARALLRLAGPMAVTSANRSSQPTPVTAEDVLRQLDGLIPLVLDGGRTPGGVPSTVVDCTGEDLHILREGPISKDEILAFRGHGL